MSRTHLALAALASTAVPGLDPVSVEGVPLLPGHQFDVAFVQDAQERRWVVRCPRTPGAAAQIEQAAGYLALLARKVSFAVPVPRGWAALPEGGRAAVSPYVPGRQLDLASLPPGPGITAELGRAIATLHNSDVRLMEEAGLPSYDADEYRRRRLADLDRAAATGRVPTGLLGRWERSLEDVGLWRFAPAPIHGDLTGHQVLATFEDDEDVTTGTIKGFTGWEDAKVADPAEDLAEIVWVASPEAVETLMEAYTHTRAERPDPHLLDRARIIAEMRAAQELLQAIASGDQDEVEHQSSVLRQLDEHLASEEPARRDGAAVVAVDASRETPTPAVAGQESSEADPVESPVESQVAGPDDTTPIDVSTLRHEGDLSAEAEAATDVADDSADTADDHGPAFELEHPAPTEPEIDPATGDLRPPSA
ncbi:phosphotransferase [Janibacter sp. G56]|uniref:phosphotransferase n=1 Tax=Janibacter sp. G56 TaxID=3418717 RepID=UPI003D0620A3